MSPPAAHAAIVTDGTLGPAQALAGPTFEIPQALGTLHGANLFHSFQTFEVLQGESATFGGEAGIDHLIARVTGGTLSTIDGLLRSEIPGADLWLLNPAGVLFGPNAALDLPASLHLSTADGLWLADGGWFGATIPEASSLTIAPPAAFGFADGPHAGVAFDRSQLALVGDRGAEIVAGTITTDGASLSTETGSLRLAAVGDGAWEVATGGSLPTGLAGGIRLTGSSVAAVADGPGVVEISGGRIELVDSAVGALNSGDRDARGATRILGAELLLQRSFLLDYAYAAGRGADLDLAIDGTLRLEQGSGAQTRSFADGTAGDLRIVAGRLEVVEGGNIESSAWGDGPGGAVQVRSGSLLVDGAGHDSYTWIATFAGSGSGDAGGLVVEVEGATELLREGTILSGTFSDSSGDGGAIHFGSGSLRVESLEAAYTTGIATMTLSQGGDAGPVQVRVTDEIEIGRGGVIESSGLSPGSGAAGSVTVGAGSIRIDGGEGSGITGILSTVEAGSGDAGAVVVSTPGALELRNGGLIVSRSTAPALGNAGPVRVEAGGLRVDGAGLATATTIGSQSSSAVGHGGAVQVDVEAGITLVDGGAISSGVYGGGDAGSVEVRAGSLQVDGVDGERATGIFSQVNRGSGAAGALRVEIDGAAELRNGGTVSTTTFAEGDAGDLWFGAGELLIDGRDLEVKTGIQSGSAIGSQGAPGSVEVEVAGQITLLAGGGITAGTQNRHDAGMVTVRAGGLLIDGRGAQGITGLFSDSYEAASGNGNTLVVEVAGRIEILPGGEISSSTYSVGDAGRVEVSAGSILIDARESGVVTGISSSSTEFGSGDAGDLVVRVVDGLVILGGGQITTSTHSTGDAGTILIEAGTLHIRGGEGDWLTGIASQAEPDFADPERPIGEPGDILIRAGAIRLEGFAHISSGAFGFADPAAPAPGAHRIEIVADELVLEGASVITAQSVGDLPAAEIRITTSDRLLLRGGSSITTEGYLLADGGPITIHGGPLLLQGGRITTSVEGDYGNGGDIAIDSAGLALDNGFIQANTSAVGASGGDIRIGVPVLLIAAGQRLLQGGDERLEFLPGSGLNVIQAAAPDGVSGLIELSTPQLDLSASVAAIGATVAAPVAVQENPCRVQPGEEASSLTVGGRAGPVPEWDGGMTPDPLGGIARCAAGRLAMEGSE